MKYLFILICVISMHACKQGLHEKENYMDISVIRDVTDPHLLHPDANSILGLYNLPENKNAGIRFRYREISDKVLVPVVDLHLPDKSVTTRQNKKNEPYFREKIILSFYDGTRKALSTTAANSDSSFLNHSECFTSIASELNILAGSNSRNRALIIFSNLFENSDILSVYVKKTNQPATLDANKIVELFEKTKRLPENLKGIKVFFVFQPATREEDFQYLKMAGVYKSLLESRGATVRIQASNNYLN